jgi:hypothetical protein
MLRQFLVVVLVSLILVLSSAFTGHNDNATVSARATTVAWTQTCSCGVDCASGTCTFDCQGSLIACGICIAGCCVAAAKTEGCSALLN